MENREIVSPPVLDRKRIPHQLVKGFMADYHECVHELPLNQKVELTEHLLGTMDLLRSSAETGDEKIYTEYVRREEILLKKFGKALKLYRQKGFYQYFELDFVLAHKDILSCEEFNAMDSIEEQRPSKEEMNRFIKMTISRLYFERDFLLLEREPEFELDEKPPIKNGINWTGSRDSKNDFVQMVYGLYRAGLINAGKGEITKIIETLAPVFNVELGKNWQSNHSASIHKVNRDYQPPVFDKVKEAYLKYAEGLIQKKKISNKYES